MQPPDFPVFQYQRQKDDNHLKLLAVFHFVMSGFALLGIGFLLLHFMFMREIFTNPKFIEGTKGAPPPREFFAIFQWFYLGMGLLLVLDAVANVLSGFFLRRKVHRMFSMVVGGLNCLQVPLGTVLGVFTLLVLMRESVRQSYEATVQEVT
jgi:hypothetical protein